MFNSYNQNPYFNPYFNPQQPQPVAPMKYNAGGLHRYNRIETYPGDTVRDVLADNPKGIYLITMNGHITVGIDGIVYDTFDCRDRIVRNVWVVK